MSGLTNPTQPGYTDPARFEQLAQALLQPDPAVDRTSLYLQAEASDFLRFNRAALRQATSVLQATVTVAVERGQRRSESQITLGGDPGLDVARLQAERRLLIGQLDLIADDPWLQRPTAPTHSRRDDAGELPEAAQVISLVQALAGGLDFVGFYAGGPVVHAFADSLGSRHWHRVASFHFDWCLYQQGDKAVKTVYGGTHWRDAEFAARLEDSATQVPLLGRTAHTLAPGSYRAAFSPAAMVELLGTLGWSGFSLKARRTGVSSLMRLARGDAAFHPSLQLEEAVAQGTAPGFSAEGFVRPGRVALVIGGALPADGGTLNSARSAAEYGVAGNGVGAQEAPDALHLAAGQIPEAELLQVLDTGLYVSNLWYLNYSDRQACRMTGMTRYACFWVEGGQRVAPVNVMRFDDDALRLFGDGLVGLGDAPQFTPSRSTYGARQLDSVTTPSAVVQGFRLTL